LPVDTPWATVSAPWYVGRNGSDLLNVIWEAQAPGGDTVYYEDPRQVGNVAEGEPVLRNVSKTEIQRFDGLSVKVYYVVTNRDNLLLSVRESLPFMMQVGVPMPTFDRPEVDEADVNDMLDPDEVPPTGATLVMPFLGTQDKDRVTYYWRGSASGGSTSDYLDMIPATVGKPVKFTVGKAYVTANRNGTVVADYSIQRGGETLGHSRELKLRIGVVEDLKEPRIKEANRNILDPFSAQDTLTAIIPAFSNMIGTQVTVTWSGTPGKGSVTTDPVSVTEQADKEITLSTSVIAFNLGEQVKVTYTVIRNAVPQRSDEFLLGVLPIANGDPRLGMPLIIEAANIGEGPTLDISALTTNATMRVNSYPFIALEQYVWLRVTGTRNDTNGSEYAKTFWQPPGSKTNSMWISQGFQTHTIPLADLKSLRNGSDLKMEFKTGLGGSADENVATTFKERVYKIKAGPALEWDNRPITFEIKTVSVEGAKPDWVDSGLLQEKWINRPPSGGVPPYTYTSSDAGVAIAQGGQIVSVRPGRCVITLQDEAGTTKTLEVTVSATEYKFLYSPIPGTLAEFEAWAEQVGGTSRVPNEFLDVFSSQFNARQNESFHLTIEPFPNGQNQCMLAGPSQWGYRVVSAEQKLQFLTIKR
jgi:hypothetical protein